MKWRARSAERDLRKLQAHAPVVVTSNDQFNAWLNRAVADLHMMTTQTPEGPYPYAGVPWFSTPFGRDGLLTAFECLWLNPVLARGVLAYLAATQAADVIPLQDAEPGKILHETRDGEMAALGEIPFGRYYGSIDATPLFVMVAGAYYQRTADLAFIQSIWPNVERALTLDGDIRRPRTATASSSTCGRRRRAWSSRAGRIRTIPFFMRTARWRKDRSLFARFRAMFLRAKRAAAILAAALGPCATSLRTPEPSARPAGAVRAGLLVRRPLHVCPGAGRRQAALPSALLQPGALPHVRDRQRRAARRTADTLVSDSSFSGWGIRTLADGEARYNPMSYHNGSVWPHDNALIAHGFARYGLKAHASKVLRGMFDASSFVDLHRLPELFCGFSRRPGEGPTLYPVACAPQAWSAAAVFMLLQACLGLEVKAVERQLCFHYPLLPEGLAEVRIENLRIGDASLDLDLVRHEDNVGINVLRREGQVEILMVK